MSNIPISLRMCSDSRWAATIRDSESRVIARLRLDNPAALEDLATKVRASAELQAPRMFDHQ